MAVQEGEANTRLALADVPPRLQDEELAAARGHREDLHARGVRHRPGARVRLPTPVTAERLAILRDAVSIDTIFGPVRSQTAFEETIDRLGTAIRLGLLPPGARLPSERDLCRRLGIARSTLRQALTALARSGYVSAMRGRGGGTFVIDALPPPRAPSDDVADTWRETCDVRVAVEVGVAVLASARACAGALDHLDDLVLAMVACVEDYATFRPADVRFHVGLAETTGSRRLVTEMTAVQGEIDAHIAHIAHPEAVLARSNDQHTRLLAAIRGRDTALAVQVMTEHLRGTEHLLAGLSRP